MASSSKTASSDHFDLLPFVAIMMCVLGCLLFITLSVVSMSLDKANQKAIIVATGQTKQPILIEWADHHSAIHESEVIDPVAWNDKQWTALARSNPNTFDDSALPPKLKALLGELTKNSAKSYALFIVRPSGFESYPAVRELFKAHKIEVGSYPIGEHKEVVIKTPVAGEPK